MRQEPLRVGVLLSGETVPAWVKRAIERTVEAANVEITHLVIHEASSPTDLSELLVRSSPADVPEYLSCCLDRLRSHALWSLLGVARQLAGTPEYRKPMPVDSIDHFSDAKRIRCRALPASDFGNRLPERVAEDVGANTDIVLRFGFGVLKGEFLTMPTHGVLSFHRGDLESYRGQPGGLWEFLNDEPTVGVTLQRIDDTLDGGRIVAEETVDIADAHTWREVERRQIAACEELLAAGVRSLRDPEHEPRSPDSLGPLYTVPRGIDVVRYASKTAAGLLRTAVGRHGVRSRTSDDYVSEPRQRTVEARRSD